MIDFTLAFKYLLVSLMLLSMSMGNCYSQSEYDSLLREYHQANKLDQKIDLLLDLSVEIYLMDRDSAVNMTQKAILFSETSGDDKKLARGLDHLGNYYWGMEEYDKARDCLNKALSIHLEQQDEAGMANSYGVLGLLDSEEGNYIRSRELFDKSFQLYTKIGDMEGVGEAISNIGHIFFDLGVLDSARHYFTRSYEISVQVGDNVAQAVDLSNLAHVNFFEGNMEEAIDLSRKALVLRKLENDYDGISIVLNDLGVLLSEVGEIDSVLYYYRESLKLGYKMNDMGGVAATHGNIAVLLMEQGDFEGAIENAYKSASIHQERGAKQELAEAYSNLGVIYSTQGLDSLSLSFHYKSLKMSREMNAIEGIISELDRIGGLYLDYRKYKPAMELHKRAYQLSKQVGNEIYIAGAAGTIGDIFKIEGEYDSALHYIAIAEDIYKSFDGVGKLSWVYGLKANVLYKLGQTKEGVKAANLAYEYSKEAKRTRATKDACYILSKLYQEQGDYFNAFKMQKEYYQLKDSLEKNEFKEKAIENNLAFKYHEQRVVDSLRQQTKDEFAQLNIEKSNARFQEEKAKKWMWSLGIGGLAIIVLLIAAIARSKGLRKMADLELENENQRIKSLIEGQEEERKRISRELHDGIGASLTAVKFKVASGANEAEELLEGIIKDIRELSHQLIPPEIEKHGMEQSLSGYLDSIANDVPFKLTWNVLGDFSGLSSQIKIVLYRITQECITNAVKYSNARELTLQLIENQGEINLMIEDDGIGFDPSKAKNGIGLKNMRSRVEELNGNIFIESAVNHGTTISVYFKL